MRKRNRLGGRSNSRKSSDMVQIKHVFGLNGKMRDSLHFKTDTEIFYQAGNNVIEYNIEEKTQEEFYNKR